MGEQEPKKAKKHLCVGLVAHVDAGKTTLAEGILYTCGRIRKPGRVDHGDAFLDNFAQERERGITIFSKQAQIAWEGLDIALLDTPGHVDFSAEMERTLQVLDYALLVISGSDGVQGHTRTLWRLLKQYGIPVFLFVNKMDQPGAEKGRLLKELQERLDSGCQEFGAEAEGREEQFWEELAMCGEGLMEEYLETGALTRKSLADAIAKRQVFPCYFGSALRLNGVEELLKGIGNYCLCPQYPEEFAARVYKISRDAAGNRLTHLKVTGGVLKVKMPVSNAGSASSQKEIWEEKADQIRIYGGVPRSGAACGRRGESEGVPRSGAACGRQGESEGVPRSGAACGRQGESEGVPRSGAACGKRGESEGGSGSGVSSERKRECGASGRRRGDQYCTVDLVEAGGICAVTGLDRTFAGQGLGMEKTNGFPLLEPVLTYGLALPEGADAVQVLAQLRRLEEEEPQLHVFWQENAAAQIHVQVMGEVQMEVLKRLIWERFGLEVEFADGHIVYKETIAGAAVGIGHFEPLRHYAEVHLLLEPGETGSGLQFGTACSEDVLDRNWQRLILSHLEEKSHPGVLTGSPLTDMKITLLTGRAHKKHTEGGDFRQAVYRALRQGLMRSKSVLLEPFFSFTLEVPAGQIGRAMSDIQRMQGSFEPPVTQGEYAVLSGSVPVSEMRDYQREVNAYTRGLGRLSCSLKGYEPCHNAQEVIEQFRYQPEEDLEYPCSSVFCAHGAGFVVSWEQVPEYAHMESGWIPPAADSEEPAAALAPKKALPDSTKSRSDYITLEEIDEIFKRTYGKSAQDYAPYRYHKQNTGSKRETEEQTQAEERRETEKQAQAEERRETEKQAQAEERRQAGEGRLEGAVSAQRGRKQPFGGAAGREEYLLVDGYNIIFAWEELRSLAKINIDGARDKLMDICCNYQGFMGCTLILVFDAYKVKGNPGSVSNYHNIHVVYTKEAETADQYIEKTVHKIGRKYQVTVATSDALEQMIIWGEGAIRLSAKGFREAVDSAARALRERYPQTPQTFNPICVPKGGTSD